MRSDQFLFECAALYLSCLLMTVSGSWFAFNLDNLTNQFVFSILKLCVLLHSDMTSSCKKINHNFCVLGGVLACVPRRNRIRVPLFRCGAIVSAHFLKAIYQKHITATIRQTFDECGAQITNVEGTLFIL